MQRITKIAGSIIIALIVIVALSFVPPLASKTLSRPKLLPEGSGLPDRDLVFTIDNGEIGFINADGSGLVTRTVSQDIFDWPYGRHSIPSVGGPATWSSDKRSIVSRYPTTTAQSGPPVFIQKGGEIHSCAPQSDHLFGDERVVFVSETQVLTVVLDVNRENKAVLVNVASCQIDSTLYQSPDEYSESLSEASLSAQGWLAINRWMRQAARSEIAIFRPGSQQPIIIQQAEHPTWSPDGEWLAYSLFGDGLYVVRKDGTGSRKVVDLGANAYLSSTNAWSPDGTWLAFSRVVSDGAGRKPAIFKINLVTGQETEIYVGGFDPDWK